MQISFSGQEPNQCESYGVNEQMRMSHDPSLDEAQPKKPKQRRKWSHMEDLVLVSAWLNTSKIVTVVNEQNNSAFWSRIAAYYNASPKLAGVEKRASSSCKQRWQKIHDMVRKFVVSFEAATKQKSSGQGDDDVMNLAYQIFLNDHKVKFSIEHAWRELRHDQKWCSFASPTDRSSKRRKYDDLSAQSSSSFLVTHEEDQARGPVVTKSICKQLVSQPTPVVEEGKALLEFQGMWEIKERLSKNKLLDSLLAKTEPLSDMELALKNKLINDMLSNS
ncbi:glutathione S-transferase T3-like [Capsella rubella]|uniref:glutathione S-transferase T3-like n=1 Tax=Capsella rubella TaxID=81985 RepID=UPI000CD5A249|nr:glutathione S-transferase T3-like [Capsella rubella]